ncbi:MAG TPA: iron uptake system protein EfeO, partial [Propionibacteriaceae bacterium]
YFTACKPGMVGDGIRAPFVVSDSGEDLTPKGDDKALVAQANKLYAAYVKDQTEQLLAETTTFRTLYLAGKDDAARALYPNAREHWERIEPIAESFGDLDPKMDLREADLESGMTWTGWHRIEKDLWPERAKGYKALDEADRKKFADDLLANTKILHQRTRTITFTVDQIANGAKGLLDEVATGKVTGEEEYWSRTDLWDFQANVDGARVAFDGLRPVLKKKDPTLDRQIDAKFVALQKLLDEQREGDGFVSYDELSKAEVKALSDAVNALSEPLSKLTAAVL